MKEMKKKILSEYDAVYQEIANGKLSSIPIIGRGKESMKNTFVGKNGNWGLTTAKERNDGTLGDLAYRNSIEKMIDAGLVSIRAIDEFNGSMRDIIGGNDTDLRNVLRFLIKRVEANAAVRYLEIDELEHTEGHVVASYVNRYERDKSARDECINEKGCACHVCGMEFEKVYGPMGKDFIHVHHLVPLHAIKTQYVVNPSEDLIPICPNCHAMLHKFISDNDLKTEEEYRGAVEALKNVIGK